MDERDRQYRQMADAASHDEFMRRYRAFQQAWVDAEAQRPRRWQRLRRLLRRRP